MPSKMKSTIKPLSSLSIHLNIIILINLSVSKYQKIKRVFKYLKYLFKIFSLGHITELKKSSNSKCFGFCFG